jgi:ribulose 1,5-bisphosphate synthetase/thiazole synthase
VTYCSAHAADDAQVAVQGGLVNVTVQDITIEDVVTVSNNNVNVVVAANIVARVCNVTVPVNVLARAIFHSGGYSCEVEDVKRRRRPQGGGRLVV